MKTRTEIGGFALITFGSLILISGIVTFVVLGKFEINENSEARLLIASIASPIFIYIGIKILITKRKQNRLES